MKIALALNLFDLKTLTQEWDHNQWLGSGWIKHFKRMCDVAGHDLRMADEFSSDDPDPIYLVQEDLNKRGEHLKNVVKSVNFCLESLMYAPEWYNNPPKEFYHTYGFGEKMDRYSFFPSYDPKEVVHDMIPWNNRDLICTIMSNQHYRMRGKLPPVTQLHDYRYLAIAHLQKDYGLKLYGKGWPDSNLEIKGSKIDVLKNYKACLVIENDYSPGYATEKVIHAIIAGCIPVYYGNNKHSPLLPGSVLTLDGAPESLFISMDKLVGFNQEDYWTWRWYRDSALSPNGILSNYTYQNFASRIFKSVELTAPG